MYSAINELGMETGVISSPITVKQVQESFLGEQLLTEVLREVKLRQTRLSGGYERLRSASVTAAEAMTRHLYCRDEVDSLGRVRHQLEHLNRAIAADLSSEPWELPDHIKFEPICAETPEARITRYDESNPVLEVTIADHRYSFTVRNVEEDSHEWLMGVISSQMQEVHDRAVHSTRQEIQTEMKRLLGIKS